MAVMPIAEHEKDQSRLMGIIKWLIAVVVILIVLLVGSNITWIVYENSFEDCVITQDVEQNPHAVNLAESLNKAVFR